MVSCKFALVFLAFIATSLIPHSNASVTWTNKGHTSATSTYTYPGARYGATTWTDSDGVLWMFSGVGTESTKSEGYLDQLYKFDFTTSKWSLVSGTTSTNQAGTYASIGSKGYPGGRYGAASWTDRSGNLWMFGGMGIGYEQGLEGPLSDLWKYNTATNTWIFVAGSPRVSAAATQDAPSARAGAVSWTDDNGNLYLFGGKASSEYFNDLWSFSTSSNSWTKVNRDVSPKARAFAASWVDVNGAAWIYGGQTRGAVLSDLWQFKNNAWTLKNRNGTSETNQEAVFPVIGGHGFPGSVHSAASWTYGNALFMFGGKAIVDGKQSISNNVWKYDIAANAWIYITGTASLSAGSLSGPGARYSTVASIDRSGKIAVFGGSGYDSPVASSHILGDTWTVSASSFAVKATAARAYSYSARAENATTGLTSGSTSSNATTGATSGSSTGTGSLTTGSTGSTGSSSTSGSTSSGSTSGAATTGATTPAPTSTPKPTSPPSTSAPTSTPTPKPTSPPSTSSTTAPTSTPTPTPSSTGTQGPTSTPTPAPQTTTSATVTLQLAMTGDPTAVDTTSLASSVAASLGVDPNTVNATIVIDGKKRAVNFHVVITVFFANSSAIDAVVGGSTTGGSGAPNITAQLAVLQQAVTSAANSTAVQSVISSSGATVTGITATTTTEQVPVTSTSTTGSTATTGSTPTSAPTTTNKNSLASNVSPSALLFAAAAVFACAYAL